MATTRDDSIKEWPYTFPMSADSALKPPTIALPDIPALAVNATQASLLSSDGEIKTLSHDQARLVLHKRPVMVCHTPYTRAKLGKAEFDGFDVLELFAFVHPTTFTTPTIPGLCKALGLPPPDDFEDMPLSLPGIAKALLGDLRKDPYKAKADPLEIARLMGMQGKGWGWTPYICSALGEEYVPQETVNGRRALNVWKNLSEWADDPPEPPPSHHGVSDTETEDRLTKLLGPDAENRTEQMQYAKDIAKAFAPLQHEGQSHIVLAEAGTGVGKTLGYLAPSSVWAEKNDGTVWISTFTKNLQRQIDQELDRLYPDAELKDTHVAIRKGRENYLCLLNLEDAAAGAALSRKITNTIATGIMARWAAATKDGDLTGADFPGWLPGILGYSHTSGLADRRGECIYSACDHYHRCFVEKSVRKSARARIVVANHALSMINAALSGTEEDMPGRYIFDEGHHLFHAADSAFSAHLTIRETLDLRRWILGAEGGRRSRARGLKRRAEDLTTGDETAEKALQDILHKATILTQEGWKNRLKDGAPLGPTESFLLGIYKQVMARTDGRRTPYSLETETFPIDDALLEDAQILRKALSDLKKPMRALVKIFRDKLAADEGYLDSDTRKRLDAVAASVERRAMTMLQPWIDMLDGLRAPPHHHPANREDGAAQALPEEENRENDAPYVDWMEIERIEGHTVDIGLYRHYVDPMRPFAAAIAPHLHGMAITSATLRDDGEDWDMARMNTGARHFETPPVETAFSSPFDYATRTKVFILNDVNKNDLRQVAGAYRGLFEASNGGALGLFTAINRLKSVYGEIARPLESNGLTLYSQHIDEIDPGTLVDMFRDDENACLLGTDAVRDGVDVPGRSLRLIAFDRTPWPRPDILHKARRKALGGRRYDEMITRMKLKQAFGRLIRRAGDKGVFVMLDSALPSRLHNAFPPDVEIVKTGLKDAIKEIRAFL